MSQPAALPTFTPAEMEDLLDAIYNKFDPIRGFAKIYLNLPWGLGDRPKRAGLGGFCSIA